MVETEREPTGLREAAWVLAPALVLGVAFGAGFIVRDCSLTCNVGFRAVPWAFLAIAALSLPMVALQVRLLAGVDFRAWQTGCAVFAALAMIGFRQWTGEAVRSNPYASSSDPVFAVQFAYLSYYVVVDPLCVLLATNLVCLGRRVYGASEAERAIAVVAAGVLGGGMLGSLLAGFVVPYLMESHFLAYETARDHLLWVVALCCFGYAVLATQVAQRFPREDPPQEAEEASPRARLWPVLGRLAREPSLRLTFLTLSLTGVAFVQFDYLFYWVISEQVDASQGRTGWFAMFYLVLNGASLGLLLFGTGRLLRLLGLALTLAALPFLLVAGVGWLWAAMSVLAICGVRIARDGFTRTLYEPAIESLICRLDPERYALIRTVLGGLGFSSGLGVGALVLLGVNASEGPPQTVLVSVLVTLALWGGVVGLLSLRPEAQAR